MDVQMDVPSAEQTGATMADQRDSMWVVGSAVRWVYQMDATRAAQMDILTDKHWAQQLVVLKAYKLDVWTVDPKDDATADLRAAKTAGSSDICWDKSWVVVMVYYMAVSSDWC